MCQSREERRKLKEERVTKKSASEKSEADSMDSTTDEEDAEEFIKDYKISAEDDVCIETYMVMCRLL